MNVRLAAVILVVLCTTLALATKHPQPFINAPLVPESAQPGQDGFTLTVNGTGFATNSVVQWNGHPRTTQFLSSSSLQATITAEDVKYPGTAWVTVQTSLKERKITSSVAFFTIRKTYKTVALALNSNITASGPVAVGDFNGDGELDAVVGQNNNDGTGTIQTFLGNGDGTFTGPIGTNVNFQMTGLLAADFNRDGQSDLAVTYSDTFGFLETHIWLSTTNGAFVDVYSLLRAVPEAAGDLNGDGDTDLVGRSGDYNYNFLYTFLGHGHGAFYGGQAIYGYSAPAAALGDFNGDGILDLATSAGSSVNVFLGNGDGTFPKTPTSYSMQYAGVGITVADVNGDGKLDIINSGVSILLGNGDGTFSPGGGVPMPYYSGVAVAVGDFNGDGKLDIVSTVGPDNTGQQYVEVLLGNGDGTFQGPVQIGAGTSGTFSSFGIGDFNNDGLLDVLVPTSTFQNERAVFSNPILMLGSQVSATPNSLDFGHQNLNIRSSPQIVTLTNITNRNLKFDGSTITGQDAGDFAERNNCHNGLPPGGSCQVHITFLTTQQGAHYATLTVAFKGSVGQSVLLAGSGEILSVSLAPPSLTFPPQLIGTFSAPQVVTVTNTGTYQVEVSTIGTNAPFHQTNDCTAVLYINQVCHVFVRFKPTEKDITNGTLSVKVKNGLPKQTVSLSGTGTVVRLSLVGVNFADQKVGTSSPPVPIKLINEGKATLSISGIVIVGGNAEDFSQVNDCGSGLPAGGKCTIKVTFTPTGTGQRSAALQINDDGGGSPQSVTLTGTGT